MTNKSREPQRFYFQTFWPFAVFIYGAILLSSVSTIIAQLSSLPDSACILLMPTILAGFAINYFYTQLNYRFLKSGYLEISGQTLRYQSFWRTITISLKELSDFEVFRTSGRNRRTYLGCIGTMPKKDSLIDFLAGRYVNDKYNVVIPLDEFTRDQITLITYTLNQYL